MQLTQDLRSTLSLDRLLEKALDSLLQMFSMARRGVVLLQGDQASMMPRSMVRFRLRREGQNASLNRSVLNAVMTTNSAVTAEDGMTMCVPILDRRDQADSGSSSWMLIISKDRSRQMISIYS
jgi:hypothetical protein